MPFSLGRIGRSSGWVLAAVVVTATIGCTDESSADSSQDGTAGFTQLSSTTAGSSFGGTGGRLAGAGGTGGILAGAGGTAGVTSLRSTNVAEIYVVDRLQASNPQLMVSAYFRQSVGENKCASSPVKYGDCTFYPACAAGYTDTIYANAGTLSITSTKPVLNVSMEKTTGGSYSGTIPVDTHFDGDETAHIAAVGAEVPAFETDIAVPLVLVVEAPAVDSLGEIVATSDSDLVITISRGGVGVDIYAQGDTDAGSMTCQAPSLGGKLTITAEAMTAIGPGAKLPLWTHSAKTITAGDWELTVGSIMGAYTPDRQNVPTVTVL